MNNTSINTGPKVEIQIHFFSLSAPSFLFIMLYPCCLHRPHLSLPLASLSSWQWTEGVRVINRRCPMLLLCCRSFSPSFPLSPFPVSAHRTPGPTACSSLSAKKENCRNNQVHGSGSTNTHALAKKKKTTKKKKKTLHTSIGQ